jgi:hypothetical protein
VVLPPIPAVPVPPPGWHSLPSLRHFIDGQSTVSASVQPPVSSQTGVTRLSSGHMGVPQTVPAGWLPLSTHWDTPVEHDVAPVLHLFATVQGWFAMQVPHVPEWQTFPDPHVLPSVA